MNQVLDSLSMNCITDTVSLALGDVSATTLEGQHRVFTAALAPGGDQTAWAPSK